MDDLTLAIRYLFALPYQEVRNFLGEDKFIELLKLSIEDSLETLTTQKTTIEQLIAEVIKANPDSTIKPILTEELNNG